ncbi:hypothetical protein ACJIZ3_005812 [Penstemon smallii]|uniref:Protein kinase domain-containing protein n=1 Tax=Penstemon smallii TaxID=265156 RepID=A0ABD3S672_9LAMI
MSRIYDNWERLVAATLKREQLWQLFHEQSRSPSIRSEASDLSSSSSSFHDVAFEFSSSSTSWKQTEEKAHPKLVLDLFLVSSELLGRGTFGSVYAAYLDNGVKIVVRRLKLPLDISKLEVERHMEIVRNVRHENVVALRAYYCSEDARLMLYDHYREGTVHALLHGNDLGLTNMMATRFMPTEWCYAPEVRTTPRNISQSSDVYSFGVLILELLTRKSAIAVDLVKLVTSIKTKAWAAKVFDEDLLKNPEIKDRMVKMLQIGISCVAKSLKKRPKMSAVVRMLEDISTITSELENNNTSNNASSEDLVFVDGSKYAKFNRHDLLEARAEILGKGTFGTSYKATLEKGITVIVKRLNSRVQVTSKEFQQQMEVIGKAKHENVAEPKAYYFSRDEKLLVFDYYNQGSLSAMLQGTHLDWETRLKIAIGAARGIAHIHKQEDGKLVHGNIKASNIFLNGRRYGMIISDVGLPQMSVGTFRPAGYYALTNTRNLSQASDVYSFGVVLLELVSGKLYQYPKNYNFSFDDEKVIPLDTWIQTVIGKNKTAEVVFDVELLRDGNENDEDAMMQLLKIGMDCVAIGPSLRPTMAQVLKMLEEISGIETEEQSSIELRLSQSSIESRFEELLEDLLPTLIP